MQSSWWHGLAAAFALQATAADLSSRSKRSIVRTYPSARQEKADGDIVMVNENAGRDKSNTLSWSIDADDHAASLMRQKSGNYVHSLEGQAELEVKEETEGQKHVEKDEDKDESEDMVKDEDEDESKDMEIAPDGSVVMVNEHEGRDKSNTLSGSNDADDQAASLMRKKSGSSVHSLEGQAEPLVKEEKEGQKYVEKDEDEDESEDVEIAHEQDYSKKVMDSRWINVSSPEHRTDGLIEEFSNDTTQGCESKFGQTSFSAACILLRGQGDQQEVLLVNVYYDRPCCKRGWDLPGGTRHHGEPGCKVAERETCEETKYSARAVEKIGGNTFKCELTEGYHQTCTKRVDEGPLEKKWVKKSDLGSVHWRTNTWGNKKRNILKAMGGGPSHGDDRRRRSGPSGHTDECGCPSGQGWSSRARACRAGSKTEGNEPSWCRSIGHSGHTDACGCPSGQGWSSRARACRRGSKTEGNEPSWCRR